MLIRNRSQRKTYHFINENLISNAERRAILNNDDMIMPRMCDILSIIPGITGKVELVFEGEQEGSIKVAKALVSKSVREIFKNIFRIIR